MKIFISWSGTRSNAFAKELSNWLKCVNHHFRPWLSDNDIPKGSIWFNVIGEKLSKTSIGLICVTPENFDSPWLHFEAGALSKEIGESKVCPILLGMSPSELEGPLSLFQTTTLEK